MKTYLTHKNKIRGFKDVSETVKTVEKIAASFIHFLKQESTYLYLYIAEIERALRRLSLFYYKEGHPLLQKKFIGKKLLIIITGDKGLVGGLWHMIMRAFLNSNRQYQSIVIIGAKGKRYLEEENIQFIKSFKEFSDIPQEVEAKEVTDYIFSEFKKGKFSQVDILYPKFISLVEQKAVFVNFIPFEFKLTEEQTEENSSGADVLGIPIFEPASEKIFDALLQKYVGVFFYKIVMESKLSEFSAKTVAMEDAAVKTKELINKLILSYAKERRSFITQKQLESFAAHKILK